MFEDTTVRTGENIVPEDDEVTPVNAEDAAALHRLAKALGVPLSSPNPDEVDRLRRCIADMQHDWSVLNRFLNQTAMSYGWCGDWERRLLKYNSQFRTLVLEGRNPNQYGVAFDSTRAGRRVQLPGQSPKILQSDPYGLGEETLSFIASCPECNGTLGANGTRNHVRNALEEAQHSRNSAREFVEHARRLYEVARMEVPSELHRLAGLLGRAEWNTNEVRDNFGNVWRRVEEPESGG